MVPEEEHRGRALDLADLRPPLEDVAGCDGIDRLLVDPLDLRGEAAEGDRRTLGDWHHQEPTLRPAKPQGDPVPITVSRSRPFPPSALSRSLSLSRSRSRSPSRSGATRLQDYTGLRKTESS